MTWKECASIPVNMHFLQAILIGDTVYAGGGSANGKLLPDVVKYSTTRNKWSKLAPAPVVGFGLGHLGGGVVLVGGMTVTENSFTGKIHSLDATSQQWMEKLPAMPTARRMLAVISHKGIVLVVCGGVGRDGMLNTVEMLNRETLQWHTLSPLPIPWAGMSTAIIGNTCFLMGGVHKDKNCQFVLQCQLDRLHALTWIPLPNSKLFLPSAAILGGSLLSIGGVTKHIQSLSQSLIAQIFGSILSDCIYVYHPGLSQWLAFGDSVPTHYAGGSVVSLPENKLLIISGGTAPTWLGEFHCV